jgi:hypothetical protein
LLNFLSFFIDILLLLALINLAIFFQNNDLGSRVASTATLMVAYLAFLPTIRQRIPPSPKFTLIDFTVYSLIFTSMLCLLRSFIDCSSPSSTYSYDWKNDPLYLISGIIDITSLMGVFIMLCMYKIKWEPSYNVN